MEEKAPSPQQPRSAGTSPLCLILGSRLGFTETQWDPPAAPLPRRIAFPPAPSVVAWARVRGSTALQRAALAKIPSSSHPNPDGSQHELAGAQPCPPQASTAFKHPSARPVAEVPGIRPWVYPTETSCTLKRPPSSKTRTHTRAHAHTHTRTKAKSTRLLHHRTRLRVLCRVEHHSLIVTA